VTGRHEPRLEADDEVERAARILTLLPHALVGAVVPVRGNARLLDDSRRDADGFRTHRWGAVTRVVDADGHPALLGVRVQRGEEDGQRSERDPRCKTSTTM
jgi:hypothetical protein